MIVVTGATGALGRLVVEALLEKVPARQIVAAVRTLPKATDLAARGVQVREADYDRPETLASAFTGADRVLLISGNEVGRRIAQHRAAVEAARQAGVGLLAYTSVLGGDRATFALADEHKATEAVIRESGLPFVLLRNGWYTENYTEHLGSVLEQGTVVASAGQGRVASAARADYAQAAAEVLTGESRGGAVYELSGDTAWSFAEYAAEVGRQTGREISYADVPAEQHLAILTGAGMPEPVAELLVGVDAAIARGELGLVTGDLSRLIGRPTTALADSIAAALKG